MNKEQIGARIKARRKELGLTQVEFAAQLPKRNGEPGETLTAQAVSNWERGSDEVPEDRYSEIAAALKSSVEELFGQRHVRDDSDSRLQFALAVADAGISAAARTILHRIVLDRRIGKMEEGRLVYSGSLRTLASCCNNLTLPEVKAAWPEVMNSGFVERVTDAEWHIAMVFP